MLLHANAKINWALDTVGLRDDGYHLLDTIMQSISLHDDITIEQDSKLSLSVKDAPHVPCDESNLILRAAEALCSVCFRPRVRHTPPGSRSAGVTRPAYRHRRSANKKQKPFRNRF